MQHLRPVPCARTPGTRACRTTVDDGLCEPDPWTGFCLVVERICELHARDRGLTSAFMAAYPHARDFAADRDHSLRGMPSWSAGPMPPVPCGPTSCSTTW